MICALVTTLVFAAELVTPAAVAAEPEFVIEEAKFPYPSAQAALDALLENREATVTVKDGWTIVDEVADGTHVNWSFTPESHPAHPSVVRRAPIEKDGEFGLEMSWRCDARNQAACSGLFEEFRELNPAMLLEFKRRLGLFDHPRQAEAIEFAQSYLDMVDQGRDDESLALLTSYSRSGYTPVEWRRLMGESRSKLGALVLRRMVRISWFENPPGVPLTGTFAFMEFEAIYEHEPYLKHYVVLHAEKGGAFRIMKDEAPFLRLRKVQR